MSKLVEAQRVAVEEVKQFTDSSNQIKLIASGEWNGCVEFKIEIDTSDFTRRVSGLEVRSRERVSVLVSRAYPAIPPLAVVDHMRWVGFPHVLQGTRLCIYLDQGTEWDPTQGMSSFLLRLWEWFEDAIGGRFNPATALYHPVGGVLHRTSGAPTVVAAHSIPDDIADGGFVRRIGLRSITDHRIDIEAWKPPYERGLVPGLLVILPEHLPLGGGHHLSDFFVTVAQQLDRDQLRKLKTVMRRLIRGLDDDGHLHVIVAVPSPVGGNRTPRHLIGWRLRASDAAKSFTVARSAALSASGGDEPEVEWTYVDDQRAEVAVRRDSERPVTVYAGAKIAVWGCGALGSWIAELLVRAGAWQVTLRDPEFVTRGLLVRQNYTEEDVGRPKAEALVERLRRLSDSCEITGIVDHAQAGLEDDASNCDFIFDTTVNTAVNADLGNAQKQGTLRVPVVQAAIDNQTATLGIITISDGPLAATTSELDHTLYKKAARDASLAPFLTFWDHDAHPPLTPAPGCSVPTFHGSGADAMGVAASVVSVAAMALSRRVAGGYLLALPHAPFEVTALTSVFPSTQPVHDAA